MLYINVKFYSVLFCSILFYSILFASVLFSAWPITTRPTKHLDSLASELGKPIPIIRIIYGVVARLNVTQHGVIKIDESH